MFYNKFAATLTRAQIEENIRFANEVLSTMQTELDQRPEVDIPFWGYYVGDKLVGWKTLREACDNVVKQFPDKDPETLQYQAVQKYYKHIGE